MLKMYLKQSSAGNTPDFWEKNWEGSEFEESLKFCPIDPMRPLFEKYSNEGSLMLEGGCGLGQYLAYYKAKGRRVVGLDFAQQALRTLHNKQNDLDLCGGDVSKLPFADETFDLYYSGGVVEHFEDGAENSLNEAQRVLKKDGTLLISVPYFSPLRRILAAFKSESWRRVHKPEIDKDEFSAGRKFFQYAYQPAEFEKMLAKANLRVVERQGYAVVWGLQEIPFFNHSEQGRSSANSQKNVKKAIGSVTIGELIEDKPLSLLKKLVVSEDDKVPLLGVGVKFMRWASANMMMYVCKKNS